MAQLDKEYIQPGKLKYAVREFPLEAIHPLAFKASEAASCAAEQGKYFEYHDLLFANQKALTPADLASHSGAVGLDGEAFKACFESGRNAPTVRRDLEAGQKAGVRGTPTLFLGFQEGSVVRIHRIVRGAQPFAVFKGEIDKLLNTR